MLVPQGARQKLLCGFSHTEGHLTNILLLLNSKEVSDCLFATDTMCMIVFDEHPIRASRNWISKTKSKTHGIPAEQRTPKTRTRSSKSGKAAKFRKHFVRMKNHPVGGFGSKSKFSQGQLFEIRKKINKDGKRRHPKYENKDVDGDYQDQDDIYMSGSYEDPDDSSIYLSYDTPTGTGATPSGSLPHMIFCDTCSFFLSNLFSHMNVQIFHKLNASKHSRKLRVKSVVF